ncbi:hypothetical protein RBH29_17615 [Herbivorax sp. ANBcel31]|uniref:hypothetical protein n=1 Tax=Herbivorax sp. ANBcel31 TaxID=3069754 RepID=UPI0027B85C3F|nr:hypothetical protein [Herbivorax sp. ANBcel31]MDQ2088245.1 hypothetical protein [Herbivorax sp. ANBcel31]
MIRFEKVNIMNLENAIRGARNPMNSWSKFDSYYDDSGSFIMGENDIGLAKRLCRAGSDHRKFMRQIFVSVDITAPLYWWKEFDTYKVGTTANSTSTMHKIHSKPFELGDFSWDKINNESLEMLNNIILHLDKLRNDYNRLKEKSLWYSMIQLLPSSYNQLRTCTMTYENIRNMYHSRKNHKLDEWQNFCSWVETLPYSKELITTD